MTYFLLGAETEDTPGETDADDADDADEKECLSNKRKMRRGEGGMSG